jgi:hypothetical protein
MAISVDRKVHASVLRAADQDNVSVSAWMTAAARHSLRIRDGLDAVAEWEAEHSPLTEQELEAARRRLLRKHTAQRRRGKRAK